MHHGSCLCGDITYQIDAELSDQFRAVGLGNVRGFGPVPPAAFAVVVAPAVEEADEFIKAVMDGVELVLVAAVPFTEEGGGVALFIKDA